MKKVYRKIPVHSVLLPLNAVGGRLFETEGVKRRSGMPVFKHFKVQVALVGALTWDSGYRADDIARGYLVACLYFYVFKAGIFGGYFVSVVYGNHIAERGVFLNRYHRSRTAGADRRTVRAGNINAAVHTHISVGC